MPRTLYTAAVLSTVFVALLTLGGLTPAPAWANDDPTLSKDKCIACHSNPEYLVTNKKLFDYFQNWRSSVHGLEGVACVDCHGGNSTIATKDEAHATRLTAEKNGDAVSYERVPDTCGACHESLLSSYRTSRHFRLMKDNDQHERGPNCVTCHGSLNAAAPDVRTVAATCQLCHNADSANHPETPARAVALLNDLNTIRGFRLYVSRRGEGDTRDKALREIDAGLSDLARRWHTFDVDGIGESTKALLALSKSKFEAVRGARSKPSDG